MLLILWFGLAKDEYVESICVFGVSSSTESSIFALFFNDLYMPNLCGRERREIFREYPFNSWSTLSMNILYFIFEILWLNLTALVRVSFAFPKLYPTHPHMFLHKTSRGCFVVLLLRRTIFFSVGCCAAYFLAASIASSALVSNISGFSFGFSCLSFSVNSF